MIKEINKLNILVFEPLDLKISRIIPDSECEDYCGFNFKVNETNIKFRKSKLTPKKTGQFVTFWKRDSDGKTVPFEVNDHFDFYIIDVEERDNHGFFLLPKTVLETNQILSNSSKEGKRGFRIYTNWHFPENKQAEKTKQWQTEFFINFSNNEKDILEKVNNILNFENSN